MERTARWSHDCSRPFVGIKLTPSYNQRKDSPSDWFSRPTCHTWQAAGKKSPKALFFALKLFFYCFLQPTCVYWLSIGGLNRHTERSDNRLIHTFPPTDFRYLPKNSFRLTRPYGGPLKDRRKRPGNGLYPQESHNQKSPLGPSGL